jgi:hypothetical protein
VTDQDPIERQLQERLSDYCDSENPPEFGDLRRELVKAFEECAALRKLCREVLNDDRTIEQWSKLRAAGAGEEVL